MEDYYLFHTPPTLLMDSIPHDLMNNNTFDTTITNYDHVFDEFMLLGNEYDGNGLCLKSKTMFHGEGDQGASNSGLLIDAVEDLLVDGNASASRVVEESPEEKQGDGNSSRGAIRVAKPRRDRSRTLISERRRRGRMKEKLYELRSLVPNITKMDKVSIIADAIVYVQNLQRQARKLAEEIMMLESSSKVDQLSRIPFENTMKASQVDEERSNPVGGKVLQLMAFEVGKGRFYVRLECSKSEGVSSSLYTAIESLGCFHLESSNISIASEIFVLTLILNVRGFMEEMNVSTLKLWVISAILKEGFEFEMTAIL